MQARGDRWPTPFAPLLRPQKPRRCKRSAFDVLRAEATPARATYRRRGRLFNPPRESFQFRVSIRLLIVRSEEFHHGPAAFRIFGDDLECHERRRRKDDPGNAPEQTSK